MPRDSSGTYTTPAGQPVTSGTTISSTVFNALVNDLKTEMTDSLSRSGNGGMLVPLPFADGNVSAPGISFDNETNSGLYRAGAGDVRLAVLGADMARWTTAAGGGAYKVVSTTSSGNFSHTGDTTETDVTNVTLSITTHGRPVILFLEPDPTAVGAGYIALTADGGGARDFFLNMYRGATKFHSTFLTIPAGQTVFHPLALMSLDAPAVGTYTYKLTVTNSNNAATSAIHYAHLVAYEL
jgi:hypothetical protein